MESFEDFNIKDPKYKKVEDLPRAVQPDFVDVDNKEGEIGFVKKSAAQNDQDAERQAYLNKNHGENPSKDPYNTMDVLHQEASKPQSFKDGAK